MDGLLNDYTYILQRYGYIDAFFYYKRQKIYISALDQAFFTDVSRISSLNINFLIIKFVKKIVGGSRLIYDYFSQYNYSTDIVFYPFNWFTKRFTYWDSTALIRSGNDVYHVFSCNYVPLGYVKEQNNLITSGGSNIVARTVPDGYPLPLKGEPNGQVFYSGPFTLDAPVQIQGLLYQLTLEDGDNLVSVNANVNPSTTFAVSEDKRVDTIYNNFFGLNISLNQTTNQLTIYAPNVDYMQTFQKAFMGASSMTCDYDYNGITNQYIIGTNELTRFSFFKEPIESGLKYEISSNTTQKPIFSTEITLATVSGVYNYFWAPVNKYYTITASNAPYQRTFQGIQYHLTDREQPLTVDIVRNSEKEGFTPLLINNSSPNQELQPWRLNRLSLSSYSNDDYDPSDGSLGDNPKYGFMTFSVNPQSRPYVMIGFVNVNTFGLYNMVVYYTDTGGYYTGYQYETQSIMILPNITGRQQIVVQITANDGSDIDVDYFNTNPITFYGYSTFTPPSLNSPGACYSSALSRNKTYMDLYGYLLMRRNDNSYNQYNMDIYFIVTDQSNMILASFQTNKSAMQRFSTFDLGRDIDQVFNTYFVIFPRDYNAAVFLEAIALAGTSWTPYSAVIPYNNMFYAKTYGVSSFYSIDGTWHGTLSGSFYESQQLLNTGTNIGNTNLIGQCILGEIYPTGPGEDGGLAPLSERDQMTIFQQSLQISSSPSKKIQIFSDENANNGIRFFREAFSLRNYLSMENDVNLVIVLEITQWTIEDFEGGLYHFTEPITYPMNLPNFPYISFNCLNDELTQPKIMFSDLGVQTYQKYTPFFMQNDNGKKIFLKPWNKRNLFRIWCDVEVPFNKILMYLSRNPSQLINY